MVPGLDEVRKGAVVVRKAVVRRDEGGKEYCWRSDLRPENAANEMYEEHDTFSANVESIL